MAHEYLVGRAAHTRQVYARGPFTFGIGDHFGILRGDCQYFRQLGLMAMYDDIDFICFKHSQLIWLKTGRVCRT
jgi:hypothetical protein